MNPYTILIIIFILADIIPLVLTIYTFSIPNSPISHSFGTLLFIIFGWAMTGTLTRLALSPEAAVFWSKCTYFFVEFGAVCWITFAFQYSGRYRLTTPSAIALFSIIPIITTLIVFFNEQNGLIWQKLTFFQIDTFWYFKAVYGSWFLVHSVYCYSLFSLGTVIIILETIRGNKTFWKQTILLIVGSALPLFLNLLFILQIFPSWRFDITPIGFAFGGLFISMGLFRFRMLELIPVANHVVVQNIRSGVVVLNLNNTILSINPFAEHIFDESEKVLIGASINQIIPDWNTLFIKLEKAEGNPVEHSLYVREETRFYDISLTGLSSSKKKLAGRILVFTDITERKSIEQAEREQRLFTETLRDIAVVLNSTLDLEQVLDYILEQSSRIVPFNAADILLYQSTDHTAHVVRSRGYEIAEMVEGTPAKPPILHVDQFSNLSAIFTTFEPFIIDDVHEYPEWIDLQGLSWVNSCVTAAIISRDNIIGFISLYSVTKAFFQPFHIEHLLTFADQAAIALDNASLYNKAQKYAKELELSNQKANVARTAAEEANNAKGEFLANMSHEIRTPMNAIIGFSHLILNTELSFQQHDYIEKIRLASSELLYLINDILDFSKIEARKLMLEHTFFYLDQLLDEIGKMLMVQIEEKSLELIFQIAPDVPLALIGDSFRLKQVVLNLTNNAIKFTERGEIVVSVNFVKYIDNQVILQFCVHDTGIGITPEQQKKIFKAFTQADGSTTRKYGGTGLGLIISQRLINLMGGEISVKSRIGFGSDFSFMIPIIHATDIPDQRFEVSPDLKNKKILVADRNITLCESLKDILMYQFRTVKTVHSRSSVLDELKKSENDVESPYDLVILDQKMQVLDGEDITYQIRNNFNLPHLPIIYLANMSNQIEKAAIIQDTSLTRYLEKPVSLIALFTSISEIFCQRSEFSSTPLPGIKRATKPLSKSCILIVDDSEINRQILCEMMTGFGATVEIASSGQQAIDILIDRHELINTILMDLHMPVMDGYETTHIIRKELNITSLPIIAVTAHALITEKRHCIEMGMNDHISKPIDPDQLLSVTSHWIHFKCPQSQNVLTEGTSIPQPDLKKIDQVGLVGIDLDKALHRFKGNRSFLISLLYEFQNEFSDIIPKITLVLKDEDYIQAQSLIHTIKGIAGNLSLMDVHTSARNLEKVVLNHDVDQIEKELASFKMAVEQILQTLNQPSWIENINLWEK